MRFHFLLAACLWFSFTGFNEVSGQENKLVIWRKADTAWQPLPRGVHVYYTTDSMAGGPFRACYVSIPLKKRKIKLAVGVGKRETPDTWYQQNGQPFLVVNTSFFSIPDGRVLNLALSDGEVLAPNVQSVPAGKNTGRYHYLSRSAIGFDKRLRPDVAWPWSDSLQHSVLAWQDAPPVAQGRLANPTLPDLFKAKPGLKAPGKWRVDDAVGGGPVLVKDARLAVFNNEERLFAGNADTIRHPRTAIGYVGRKTLIIMMVEGRNPGVAEGIGLPLLAQLFTELGCREALNLDGGGSSCLLINGRETLKPSDKTGQRPVPAVLMLWGKK